MDIFHETSTWLLVDAFLEPGSRSRTALFFRDESPCYGGKDEMLTNAAACLQKRELAWQLGELRGTLSHLKQSLEDCYKLLGPDGQGNTLVVSTPRNEAVKGHITRLGTQIVRGVGRLFSLLRLPLSSPSSPSWPLTALIPRPCTSVCGRSPTRP